MEIIERKVVNFRRCNAFEKWSTFGSGRQQLEFWSYSTPMIIIDENDNLFLNENKYSRTTSKQVNQWCREREIDLKNASLRTEREMRDISIF